MKKTSETSEDQKMKKSLKEITKTSILSYIKGPFAFQALIVVTIIVSFIYVIEKNQVNSFVKKEKLLREKQTSDIAKAYNQGSTLPLTESTTCTIKGFELLYNEIFSPNINLELKSTLEVATLLTKLDFVKKVFSSHPKEMNENFRINELREKVSFGYNNMNATVEKTFLATYEENLFLPEETYFNFFLVLGYDPPDSKNLNLSIENLNTGSPIEKEDIIIIPIGTKTDTSQLYKISLKIRKKDFKNKTLYIKVNKPIFNQSIPFSFHELHAHRYLRGIGTARIEFQFATPSFLNYLCVERGKIKIISCDDANVKITSKKGNDDDGYTNVVYTIESPSSPYVFTYLQFWKGKIPGI